MKKLFGFILIALFIIGLFLLLYYFFSAKDNIPVQAVNEKFVQSIIDLKDNDIKKKKLAKNGFDIIQKYYTKEKVVSKYLELFEKLL